MHDPEREATTACTTRARGDAFGAHSTSPITHTVAVAVKVVDHDQVHVNLYVNATSTLT